MTSKEVVNLALFSCHQPKAEDDDPEPTQKSERIKHTMDYESFKEKFVEDLKDRLDEQGFPDDLFMVVGVLRSGDGKQRRNVLYWIEP